MVKEFSFPEILENDYIENDKKKRSELIRRAKNGDEQAAKELYTTYKARVYTEEEIGEFQKNYEIRGERE